MDQAAVNDTDALPTSVPMEDRTGTPPVDAARPRIWPSLLMMPAALIVASVAQAVVMIIMVAIFAAEGGNLTDSAQLQQFLTEKLSNAWMFMALTGSAQVALLLFVIFAAYLSPVPFARRLRFAAPIQGPGIYLPVVLGSWGVLWVSMAAATLVGQVIPADPSILALFENMPASAAVPFVLMIALLPGFGEEMMFRGFIQSRLEQRYSPAAAIILTSVLFAVMHVQIHHVAVALPLGLWFGVIAWRCGSILPCILGHAAVNGGLNAWRMVVKFLEPDSNVQMIVIGVVTVASIVGYVACMRLMFRPAAARPSA